MRLAAGQRHPLVASVGPQIEQALDHAIRGKPILLTEESEPVRTGQAVSLPKEILDVWPARTAAALFDSSSRPPVSREIKGSDYEELIRKQLAGPIEVVIPAAKLIHLFMQGKLQLAPAAYWIEFEVGDLQLPFVT
jgi:hypothetical protein